jgi:hypothetical protein
VRAIPGSLRGRPGPVDGPTGVIIDNRTGLPDAAVREAIQSSWVENAAIQMGDPTSFQLYATSHGAGMLGRSPFRTPSNVIEEVRLARQVSDTDDDIAATLGQAIADAFGSGMQNQHEDEQTVALFNRICGPVINGGINMDSLLKELYREYLIAGSINTISLYSRKRYNFTPRGTTSKVQKQLSTPLVGVLPAEDIRVVTNDIFGTGELAYHAHGALRDWLDVYFKPSTSAAIKAKMAREQPVLAALFTGRIEGDFNDPDPFVQGKVLFTLNQRMVHRTTMPKGASAYPRPLLTANFALLEAKRLLNIMDYSLLQGGTNYIVVAKVGSDQLPAQQPEVDNLEAVVRGASRTGVLVGDHRVSIDIITPDLTELLNPAKRKLIGRKLAMMMLRIPEQVTGDSGGEGSRQELEFTARTIESDRRDIKRHVEGFIYEEIVARNSTAFTKGSPNLWFPKIVLAGTKDFQTLITAARDRGDIPRKYAVEALGFDYEAGVAQRKAEKARGDDEVMTPGAVPFQGNPADGGAGRPPGSGSNNGGGADGPPADPAQRQRQPRLIQRQRGGEPVRADWSQGDQRVLRYGELTAALLEQYPAHTVGRVTSLEREAASSAEITQAAGLTIVPVNAAYEVGEVRAFRLTDGLSLLVGQRTSDDAVVARALCFREPEYDLRSATEAAMRFGFIDGLVEDAPEVVAGEVVPVEPQPSRVQEVVAAIQANPEIAQVFAKAFAEAVGGLIPNINLTLPGEAAMEFVRDENGAIVGKRPVQP